MERITVKDSNTGVVYKKGKLLGKGGFAKCYEFKDSQGQIMAGKVVAKKGINNKSNKEKLYQEIMIHRNLNHENIVSFFNCFEDEDNVYIMLELCSNKTLLELHKRRRTITDPETRYYSKQIAFACSFIHQNQIIHRDLKLANVFLNTHMKVKIGDFGLASKLDHNEERRKTMCGTPNYIAPEILRKEGHSYEVDMWSLGCIIYTLLVGKPPFETENLRETYNRIKRNEYTMPANLTLNARSVIQALLHSSPDKRPTMNNLVTTPYFLEFTPNSLPISALTTEPRFDTIVHVSPNTRPLQSLENTLCADQPVIISGNGVAAENNDVTNLNKLHCLLRDILNYAKVINVTSNPNRRQLDYMDDSEDPTLAPVYWVSKWVDYSDRYGLGYQLSDGSSGVVFNDTTRIILSSDYINIQYIEKDGTERLYTTHSNFSPALQKKKTLLTYFRQYMNENLLTAGENMITSQQSMVRLPYVKAWFRTRSAIAVYLSNGAMQINMFGDHTKMIMCPLMQAITILDGASEFKTFKMPLIKDNGITGEMRNRVEYCERMISKMERSINPV